MQQKSFTILLCVLFILGIIVGSIVGKQIRPKQEEVTNFKIVTSFYPLYVLTANLTEGANHVKLVNMTETNVGCLHDYTLTTNDMKKIEKANVFIENGLGLESFNKKMTEAYPNLKVIDSSQNISNLFQEVERANPHVWTSLKNYISQVETITQALKETNPENATIYQENSDKYLEKLQNLQKQYDESLTNCKGKKAICLNEALAYLANAVEIQATVIETDHEESTLSAEVLKTLVKKMKAEEISIILVEKEDNLKNAQTLQQETKAEIYKLNASLTGELEKDAYLKAMQENLKELQTIK